METWSVSGLPGFAVNVLSSPISFHLPLHRFTSLLMSECTLNLGLETEDLLGVPDSDYFYTSLLEHPLQVVVCSAQIQAGLWRRNGNSVYNQSINYRSCPIAAHMMDLDIPLLRMIASQTAPEAFISQIVHRFGLLEWWFEPRKVKSTDMARGHESSHLAMAESCLSLLIVLFSELHRYQPDGETLTLRRELIHRLCVHPCAHSEFVECITSLSRSRLEIECRMEELDEVVREVALYRTPTGMQQGKYELKESCYKEYDAYFFHLSRVEHQEANEYLDGLCKSANTSRSPPPPPPVDIIPPKLELLPLLPSLLQLFGRTP